MDNTDVIIIGNDFTKTGVAETKDYVVHALCTRGACSFVYNDRKYDFRKDNLLIIREHQLMRYIMPRHDFEVMVLYIHLPFIENITPDINFGIRSTLLLLENPILRLTKKEVACSLDDMNAIVGRVEDKRHAFRSQAIGFSCLSSFWIYSISNIASMGHLMSPSIHRDSSGISLNYFATEITKHTEM